MLAVGAGAAGVCGCARVAAAMGKRQRGEAVGGGERGGGGAEKPAGASPSGDCPSAACHCRSTADAVNAALARVQSAKAFGSGGMPSRGPLNDERVLRAICDDYLSHSRGGADLKPKQVRLREALRRVAVRLDMPFLSSFNCKTTSLRTLGRALWEGCELDPEPAHKAQALVTAQKQNGARVDAMLERLASRYPRAAAAPPSGRWMLLDEHARRKPQRQLDSDGIVLLPGFVDEETCEWLLSRVAEHRQRHTPTWLTGRHCQKSVALAPGPPGPATLFLAAARCACGAAGL